MMAVPDSRLAEAFLNAKRDFLSTLKSPSIIEQVSTSTSIEDINDFLHKLQTDQGNRQDLRNLRKIASYLDRLQQFSSVIEVLISSKPEILALIWGPIKLLMQMTKNVSLSFDAILDTMVKIGDSLPYFEKYTQLFKENERMADVLVLFYKDILDSYQITLNFFSAKRWIYIFESVWPKHKIKIDIVSTNIDRHRRLLTEEVNLEHIKEAHEARITILNDYQRNIDFQARQDFEAVESYISPKFYDDEFGLLQRNICERTGRWLQTDQAFQKWFDISDSSTRLVWIQGKPGAAKRNLKSNTKFARETLSNMLRCAGPTRIVIDGLDELPKGERTETLQELLEVLQDSNDTKILISSRAEKDIATALNKANPDVIRVDEKILDAFKHTSPTGLVYGLVDRILTNRLAQRSEIC
ncbi:NACHT nucleoside triphosphatase [Penicillium canescens]|nr:NACHT nucleoside triphosphatase [Penicillium canescens]